MTDHELAEYIQTEPCSSCGKTACWCGRNTPPTHHEMQLSEAVLRLESELDTEIGVRHAAEDRATELWDRAEAAEKRLRAARVRFCASPRCDLLNRGTAACAGCPLEEP